MARSGKWGKGQASAQCLGWTCACVQDSHIDQWGSGSEIQGSKGIVMFQYCSMPIKANHYIDILSI